MPLKNLADFLSHLKGVKPGAGGRFMAFCPGHDDRNRQSLSILLEDNKILLKCFAGCQTEDIIKTIGLTMNDLFLGEEKTVGQKEPSKSRGEISKIYQYTDENGKLLYEVVRYVPKNFRQRRPDDKGSYIWNLEGINPVLYHLPELIQAVKNKKPVFCVEGEKDCDNLRAWGLAATTNSGGAGKWRQEYSVYFKDAQVIIIPDIDPPDPKKPEEDPPGMKHAKRICSSLYGTAASIKLLILPVGLHEDTTDWIEKHGGTKEKLEELVATCSEWEPEERILPEITCSDVRLREITRAAISALVTANDPPFLFVRAGEIVRIAKDERNLPIIQELSESGMRGALERAANFIRQPIKGGPIPISPPLDVVRDIMALGTWPFPPLEGITETPTVRMNGSILSEPGYDPDTRLYYVPAPNLNLPPLPSNPTQDDVKNSIELLKETICDFPFDGPGSLANALAAIITPVLRPLINGPVPMTLFDKPQAGTGASLLADVTSIIATGRASAMLSAPKEDEDWRKSITSLLLLGRNVVTIDNIEGRLVSPSLAAALTSTAWQDRILGHSQMVIIPHRVSWIGTGNNIRLTGDLPRRCFWVRMDAKQARPWQRTGFRHPKLVQWITESRGTIIVAILIIAKSWILAGRPSKELPVMGSFESWVDLIGNILEFAGIQGFLMNLEEMYDTADEETPQWENFVSVWHETLHSNYYTVAELSDFFKTDKALADAIPIDIADSIEDKGFTRKLGKALAKRAGVRFLNNLVINKGRTKQKAFTWQIKIAEQTHPNTPLSLSEI